MRLKRLFSRARLGLDIQYDGVRLVKLAVLSQKHQIEAAVFAPLARDIEGDSEAYWAQVQQVLYELVLQRAWQGFKVAICVPADIVKIQSIPFQLEASDAEIELEIRASLYREQPGLRDALAIDFVRLPPNQIQYTAVREAYIQRYVRCVNAAGLKVSIVDVDVYARARALALASECEEAYLACYGAAMRDFPKW